MAVDLPRPAVVWAVVHQRLASERPDGAAADSAGTDTTNPCGGAAGSSSSSRVRQVPWQWRERRVDAAKGPWQWRSAASPPMSPGNGAAAASPPAAPGNGATAPAPPTAPGSGATAPTPPSAPAAASAACGSSAARPFPPGNIPKGGRCCGRRWARRRAGRRWRGQGPRRAAVLRVSGLVAGAPGELAVLVADAHVAVVDELEPLQEVGAVGVGLAVPHLLAAVEHLQPVPREEQRARVHRAHRPALRLPHAHPPARRRRRVALAALVDDHLDIAEVGAEPAGAGDGVRAHEVRRVLAGRRGEEQHGRVDVAGAVAARRDAGEDLLLDDALDRARRARHRRRQRGGEEHGNGDAREERHGWMASFAR